MAAVTSLGHALWHYGDSPPPVAVDNPPLWPLLLAPGNATATATAVNACAVFEPLLPAPAVTSCPDAAAPKAPVCPLVAPLTHCQAGSAPPLAPPR